MKKSKDNSRLIRLTASVIYVAIVVSVLSVLFAYNADTTTETGTGRQYFYEHISTVALIVAFVGYFILSGLQNCVYAISRWLGRPKKVDERQRNIQNEVLARAYTGVLGFGIFFAVFGFFSTGGRVTSVVQWVMLLLIVALPSMLAAFRKDA